MADYMENLTRRTAENLQIEMPKTEKGFILIIIPEEDKVFP